MILGGGPNRIGQGIEFDYCCVHAAFALREIGYETIMVNSNPETVSTDYDTSDKLYFEPLTQEDVLAIVAREKPEGSSCSSADRRRSPRGGPGKGGRAHHRHQPRLHRPGGGPEAVFRNGEEARSAAAGERDRGEPGSGAVAAAHDIGYPVLVRPSLTVSQLRVSMAT